MAAKVESEAPYMKTVSVGGLRIGTNGAGWVFVLMGGRFITLSPSEARDVARVMGRIATQAQGDRQRWLDAQIRAATEG